MLDEKERTYPRPGTHRHRQIMNEGRVIHVDYAMETATEAREAVSDEALLQAGAGWAAAVSVLRL